MSAARLDSATSFYVIGGTVQCDAACYLIRQADTDLYDALAQGKFCYVLTPRQMGKSSLMVRTAARLRETGVGVAVLDLTAIGQNLNAEQWYGGLLSEMGRRLDLEDELLEFWETHPQLGPLQRWMQATRDIILPRYPGHVVVFVDEIDVVRSLPFSTDEFFAGIREFYNRRTEDVDLERLTFCLLGVATPSDLIRDTRTTPFNIGQRIELKNFTEAEAEPLSRGLRREERLGAPLLRRVLYWTGGHPYLTQRLCQAVAEDVNANGPDGVDRLCAELFFTRRARELDDNLLFVRERMLRSEVDLTGLLGLYARVHRGRKVPDDETNPLVSLLRLSGIARAEDGRLRVRNRIYERVFDQQWVKASMPDAEVRRQRVAYRRGLLRASAVAAVILAVIAILGVLAVMQRNRAEAEARRADQSANQAGSALAEANRQRQSADEQRAEAEQQRQEAINQQVIADEQRILAEQKEQANRRLLYTAHVGLAQQAYDIRDVARAGELLAGHLPQPGQEDLRGFEWYYLWRLSHRGRVIVRHQEYVYSMAFSPDGQLLATGSADKTVKLWDLAAERELATLRGHTDTVHGAAFSPNSRTLATSSGDKTVRLWDVATRQAPVILEGHTDVVRAVAFSPDGKTVATVSNDRTLKLWDVNTGQCQVTKGHAAAVAVVAFSPDGKTLATGSEDSTVNLWDAASGRFLDTLTGHKAVVYGLTFSPNGRRLVTASKDQTVRVWDMTARPSSVTFGTHTGGMQCVAFSPDGRTLATGGASHALKVWDVATERELASFKGEGTVWTLAFSRDGKTLASGGGEKTVKFWDVSNELEERAFLGTRAGFKPLSVSPDGRLLIMRSDDQKALRLYDVMRREDLATFSLRTGTALPAVALGPQGRTLAVGGDDNTLRLWDVASRQELPELKGHLGWVNAVAFSPDGKLVATGSSDQTARLWEARTGRSLITCKGHTGLVRSVAFSPDGKTLATGGADKTIRLWEVATGLPRATLTGHSGLIMSVVFSPDGKTLATASNDETARLWSVATGQVLSTLKAHFFPVLSVAFSPDGNRLATGSADRTIKLWNVATSEELIAFKGHASMVNHVVFSSDGRTMVSLSLEGGAKLWRASTDEEVATQVR